MHASAIVVIVVTILLCVYANSSLSEYTGKCEFQLPDQQWVPLDCSVALFSKFSFQLSGKLIVLSDDLCTATATLKQYSNSIVAVKRGQCSFDQKAVNANLLKFKALFILNSAESFPMGAAHSEYVSSIPVLMAMSHEALDSSVQVRVSYGKYPISLFCLIYFFPEDKASTVSSNNKQRTTLKQTNVFFLNSVVISLSMLVFGSCTVVLYRAVQQWQLPGKGERSVTYEPFSCSRFDGVVPVICVLILSLLFVFLRLGTFRLLPALSGSNGSTFPASSGVELINSQFNHKETDEMIFQVSNHCGPVVS